MKHPMQIFLQTESGPEFREESRLVWSQSGDSVRPGAVEIRTGRDVEFRCPILVKPQYRAWEIFAGGRPKLPSGFCSRSSGSEPEDRVAHIPLYLQGFEARAGLTDHRGTVTA
jgi:hypothetical protein